MHADDEARSLWRTPDFLNLWSAQSISVAGSLMRALQLTAVVDLGTSPVQVSLRTASGVLPSLMLGLATAAWVDRARR